jgi:thiol reductant ABC exporter CydC subunit
MSTAGSTASTLRRLVTVSPPPWRRLLGAVVLGVAASGATIGLMAGSGALVDKAATRPGLGAIAGLLAVVEVVAFSRAPLRYAERLCAHDAGFRALGRWRVWLFDQLEPRSPAPLQAWRSGDLARRLVADVDALQDLYLRGLSPLVTAVVVAAGAVVVVGILVPTAAAVLGGALALALIGAPVIAWSGRTRDSDRAVAGSLAADVVDLVQGAPELVAFGRADDHLARIDGAGVRLAAAARRRARADGVATALVGLCAAGASAGVLALGIAALAAHRLEPLMLAVLPFVALGSFEVVPPLSAAALGLADVVAGGRRLLELAEAPLPVTDPGQPEPAPAGPVAVALVDASLRYRPDDRLALDGVDLSLAPGTTAALVGRSGSGKTSVLHALLRFWPLESGTCTLGGVPAERLAQRDVRARFAIVEEDGHLFAGTIDENVRLGRPDATRDEVGAALAAAQLTEWVAELPAGLDTQVGERGTQLSAGQRQRLALARALVADRPVLLLDEPGAGLDAAMADRLVSDVLAAAAGRTVLAVSHRPEEIERFETIVELEAGRVVARRRGAASADQG